MALPSAMQTPLKSPRKKKKPTRSVSFALPALPFPLASFLHPLRSSSSQWLVLPVLLMVVLLFRWAVGLGPYSGMDSERVAASESRMLMFVPESRNGRAANARRL